MVRGWCAPLVRVLFIFLCFHVFFLCVCVLSCVLYLSLCLRFCLWAGCHSGFISSQTSISYYDTSRLSGELLPFIPQAELAWYGYCGRSVRVYLTNFRPTSLILSHIFRTGECVRECACGWLDATVGNTVQLIPSTYSCRTLWTRVWVTQTNEIAVGCRGIWMMYSNGNIFFS